MALVLLSTLWLAHPVSGFSFSSGQAGECDPLSLSWSGGLSPFQLLIIPPGGTMANISIPASAYNKSSGQGSYTLPQLKLKEEQQFMLSMSDATGIFAGGTSNLLSVGASEGGQSCNTTFPDPDFTFSLDSDLAQCSPFPVTLYPGPITPTLPVRLLVNIPQGHSFVVNLPLDLSSWIANLTAGTAAAFTILDSRNKNGGTEMLRVTETTNNTSCLVSSFTPATTASVSPTETTNPQQSHTNTTALAVGISIGGFGILCIALIFFWYYRRRQLHALRARSFLDLSGAPARAAHTINAQSKVRDRHMSESSGGQSRLIRPGSSRTAESQGATSVSVYTPRTAGNPSDIVIHRDITEARSPQAIEFPPEYSANFPPIPGALLRDLTNGQYQV